jgi:hypothetical protein
MIYNTYKQYLGNDFNLTENAISLQIPISQGYLGKGLLAIESGTRNTKMRATVKTQSF